MSYCLKPKAITEHDSLTPLPTLAIQAHALLTSRTALNYCLSITIKFDSCLNSSTPYWETLHSFWVRLDQVTTQTNRTSYRSLHSALNCDKKSLDSTNYITSESHSWCSNRVRENTRLPTSCNTITESYRSTTKSQWSSIAKCVSHTG